ncbi:helix-turn-helix domain-containing protein [uncultured Selenomonas sp.]|uniref:helix-turn-helix domain-containing protein n=1 Tax=uncultured Selenomonas sp. TaxID=159275 RepID=UPI0025E1E0A7|nr:helix-turn-helix transcriptional regulator [uncultured Selenomonas sp.]
MPLTATALRLRILRTKRHLSQQEMADILGITRTAYNKYENGAIQPTLNVKKLSRFFNVSTDYLLGMNEDPAATIPNDAHLEAQIKKYLALTETHREIVDELIDGLYKKKTRNTASVREKH